MSIISINHLLAIIYVYVQCVRAYRDETGGNEQIVWSTDPVLASFNGALKLETSTPFPRYSIQFCRPFCQLGSLGSQNL